jgi:hypothetical protein
MWHRLQNLIGSLKSYNVLSPDLHVRHQVKRVLCDRPILSADDWFRGFCKPLGIRQPIANFAYFHLEGYSGLPFSQVLLSDRFNEDLHWIEVCWFDWEMILCEDFYQLFGVDISDQLLGSTFLTIEELLFFLNQQVEQIDPYS